MARRPCIWLTRPKADSDRLAATLAAQNINSIISPVMHITPHTVAPIITLPDAILLTSRHAAHALASLPPSATTLPVLCVGHATAESATQQGFHNVHTAGGDILSLLPVITNMLPTGARLFYFAGEETRVNVPVLLGAQGILVKQITAYTADAVGTLTQELATGLVAESITGISLYSPRSGALAVEMLKQSDFAHLAVNMHAFCLSLAVAEAIATLNWKSLQVCATPTSAAMRDLIVMKNLL
jgi:uroporphyrinogen-III synthase